MSDVRQGSFVNSIVPRPITAVTTLILHIVLSVTVQSDTTDGKLNQINPAEVPLDI